jgi:hypothetical protein
LLFILRCSGKTAHTTSISMAHTNETTAETFEKAFFGQKRKRQTNE